jgi:hypothetical protein
MVHSPKNEMGFEDPTDEHPVAMVTVGAAASHTGSASRAPMPEDDDVINGGHRCVRPAVALQRQAWQWALANRKPDGDLPAGRQIAHRFGRRERWGRLVKQAGLTGHLES